MPLHPDAIAECVLNAFHALPAKFKPRTLPEGRREEDALDQPSQDVEITSKKRRPTDKISPTSSSHLTCAALATGMKCLPQNKLAQAKGNVLHDSHAEVLAIRGFNRFLVDECAELAKRGLAHTGQEEGWMRWRRTGEGLAQHEQHAPFELGEDVSIHMYCSEAPCGDASMELIMAEQEDDTPWSSHSRDEHAEDEGGNAATDMLGRGHFDRLGIVRRKPARFDAPVTLSKSCSDKLTMKQCTGLVSGLTSTVVWPGSVYLSTLVLSESQYVPTAIERAFGTSGRMKAVAEMSTSMSERWQRAGYGFTPFQVQTTTKEFEFSRRSTSNAEIAGPSNLSALAASNRQEILINGVLQGRKQFDPRGASCVSRRRMWEAVRDVAALIGMDDVVEDSRRLTYGEMGERPRVEAHRRVKEDVRLLALKGWRRNLGDEEWMHEDGS